MAAASSLPAPATATTRPLRRLPPPETDDVTKRRHPERSVAERAISLDYLVVAGLQTRSLLRNRANRSQIFSLLGFLFARQTACQDQSGSAHGQDLESARPWARIVK